jgi:hypothetical protein
MQKWRNEALCDVVNLVLGAFLAISPWLFAFALGAETQNAIVSGIVIAVLSLAALASFAQWEEWLNLIVGLWVVVSPWVLKFPQGAAMKIDIVVGILVAAIAALELWMMHRTPPRLTASR